MHSRRLTWKRTCSKSYENLPSSLDILNLSIESTQFIQLFHSRQAKRFEDGFRKEVRRKTIQFYT